MGSALARLKQHLAEKPHAPSADDTEIAWRVETMHAQIPAHGAIPNLSARPGTSTRAGCCTSCGDTLPADHRSWVPRCPVCVEAARLSITQAEAGRANGA